MLIAGCHSYRPRAAAEPVSAGMARIRFDQPIDLVVRDFREVDTVLHALTRLEGRIEHGNGDMLFGLFIGLSIAGDT